MNDETKGTTPENPLVTNTADLPGQVQRDSIAFTAMAAARQRELYGVIMLAEIVEDPDAPPEEVPEGRKAYKMKASIQCNCDPEIALEMAAAISRWANSRALEARGHAATPATEGAPPT